MAIKKTAKMLAAEEKLGMPLEKALPPLVTDNGFANTASKLGISNATLGYWMMKCGIEIQRIAVGPRDVILVQRDVRPEPPGRLDVNIPLKKEERSMPLREVLARRQQEALDVVQ